MHRIGHGSGGRIPAAPLAHRRALYTCCNALFTLFIMPRSGLKRRVDRPASLEPARSRARARLARLGGNALARAPAAVVSFMLSRYRPSCRRPCDMPCNYSQGLWRLKRRGQEQVQLVSARLRQACRLSPPAACPGTVLPAPGAHGMLEQTGLGVVRKRWRHHHLGCPAPSS